MKSFLWSASLAACALILSVGSPLAAQTPQNERVSFGMNGQEPNSRVESPSISADGRFIAYSSYASNLVPTDTNGTIDVFLYDRQTQQTTRPVHNKNGGQVAYGTDTPRLSRDGRYLFFISVSNDVVPNSINFVRKIFVLDRQTDTVTRVTNSTTGSEPNNDSYIGQVSADGNWLTYFSFANNLVPNDTNNKFDAFVSNRDGTITERVSVSSAGVQANNQAYAVAISGDGRYALFNTTANNMVPNDTNNAPDVFLRDRQAQTTTRISVADDGSQTISSYFGSAMSPDARYICFYGYGSGFLPQNTPAREYAFLKDRATNHTELISVAPNGAYPNGNSQIGSISDDGRHVVFRSNASNLAPNDTNTIDDVFLRDRLVNVTTCLSRDAQGVPRGGNNVLLTPDALSAVFLNDGGGLVAGDNNGTPDLFIRTPLVPQFSDVSGTLTFQGIDANTSPQVVTFTFRSTGYADEVRTVVVGSNGTFALPDLPRRDFTLNIASPKFLAKNVAVNASNGDVGNVTATLKAGDANGDNVVDVSDLLLIINHYNQSSPTSGYFEAADFNSDGVNDVTDLLLVIGNYNQIGD